LAVPVDELALTARLAHPRADPLAGALDIVSVCGVGADRLDAQELTELGKPLHRTRSRSARRGVGHGKGSDVGHGKRTYAGSFGLTIRLPYRAISVSAFRPM